jgi:hypothetical protein
MYEDNSSNIGTCKILKITAKAVVSVKMHFQINGIYIGPCKMNFEKGITRCSSKTMACISDSVRQIFIKVTQKSVPAQWNLKIMAQTSVPVKLIFKNVA